MVLNIKENSETCIVTCIYGAALESTDSSKHFRTIVTARSGTGCHWRCYLLIRRGERSHISITPSGAILDLTSRPRLVQYADCGQSEPEFIRFPGGGAWPACARSPDSLCVINVKFFATTLSPPMNLIRLYHFIEDLGYHIFLLDCFFGGVFWVCHCWIRKLRQKSSDRKFPASFF